MTLVAHGFKLEPHGCVGLRPPNKGSNEGSSMRFRLDGGTHAWGPIAGRLRAIVSRMDAVFVNSLFVRQ